MRISKVILGAAILLLAVAVFSCKDDEGLGLPGTEDVKDLPAFDGSAVTTVSEAEDLLNQLKSSEFKNALSEAYQTAYSKAFLLAYGMSESSYTLSKLSETSIDISVKIDDNIPSTGTGIGIKGSHNQELSSNKPFSYWYNNSDSYSSNGAKGDKLSASESYDVSFTFVSGSGAYEYTKNYYQSSSYYSYSDKIKYKIAGFITVEESTDSEANVQDIDTNSLSLITETSSSSEKKVSATVTISSEVIPGTSSQTQAVKKGGKFVLSYATGSSSNGRYVEGSSERIISDIEVYDNSGNLVLTIRGSEAMDYLSGFSFSNN